MRLTASSAPPSLTTRAIPARRTAPPPVRRTAPPPRRRTAPRPVRFRGARGRPSGLGGLVLLACLGFGGYAMANGGLGGGSASAGTGSGAGAPATSAQVQAWISQADTVLAANGTPMTADDNRDVEIIIAHESGGNPNSVNHTDSNAAAGHPSEGLMQVIKPTFDAHCLPGYCASLIDPVSNIIAGVEYATSRYGSLANTPGVRSINAGGRYLPY